jgi:hypothetical protein
LLAALLVALGGAAAVADSDTGAHTNNWAVLVRADTSRRSQCDECTLPLLVACNAVPSG